MCSLSGNKKKRERAFMESNRSIIYLEKIRLFALFFVLYCHSGEYGAARLAYVQETPDFWISLVLYPISQCCVVLFFMISGGLLLHKTESLKRIYCHRVLPIAVVTVFVVLIQYIQICLESQQFFTVEGYFRALYSGGAITPQWFLYAYLSFLMLLPLLQRMVHAMTEESMYLYIFGIGFVFTAVLPIFEALLHWPENGFTMPLVTNIVFYPLMGHFLVHKSDRLLGMKHMPVWLNLFGILLLVGNTVMNYTALNNSGNMTYETVFLTYFAVLIFVDIKCFCTNEKNKKLWTMAGSGVFGTYLFEPQLRLLFSPIEEWLHSQDFAYYTNFMYICVVMMFGLILFYLIKLIPGAKRFL